ncbi:MAG: alpha/beta fold hydrolase, partial [Candidatus Dormiibacterota bacterium]
AAAAKRRAADAELAQRIAADGVEAFVDGWLAQPLLSGLSRRGADYLTLQRAERLANRPQGLAASLQDMGAGAMTSLWSRLGELRLPVLVVVGEEDRRYVDLGARVAAQIPSARLAIVAGAGHSVPFEQPAAFADLVRNFLNDLSG